MPINAATAITTAHSGNRNPDGSRTTRVAARKVVIINGGTRVPDVVETALDAGSYDIVFVESQAHAYSQIKRVQPNLVILCLGIDDMTGYQVLSMLKLDEDTRQIPVLTYTIDQDSEKTEDQEPESSGSGIFAPGPALRMN
jgi:PleD family two-component response regulator